MKNLLICILCLGFTFSTYADKKKSVPVLNVFSDLDCMTVSDSHAGEEGRSSLEPVYDLQNTVQVRKIGGDDQTPCYPRIKRMSDGRYIMFYQSSKIASRIGYCISSDMMTWSETVILFTPYKKEGDIRRFSTADAVVLENGDILVVCSFRATKGYRKCLGCGLMLRRSRDNGRTWSDEQVIYEGPNWEPYLLLLPDGRLQCYFTDCDPSVGDSGTSVIVSQDGGHTWGSYMKVSRQYKYDHPSGTPIYTDQMPSFRVLNDGKTLLGFLEARLEEGHGGKSVFKMSLVRNPSLDWKPLCEGETGPADRESNLFNGCAGYVSVFPSGETVVSCNINRLFSIKVGDARGRMFNGNSWSEDWLQPFKGQGYWGATEVIAPHQIVGAMHCAEGIQTGVFWLNHRINAFRGAKHVDGRNADWAFGDCSQALFIGSDSPAQVVIRIAYDAKRLYILAERKDNGEDPEAGLELFLHKSGSDGQIVRIEADASGYVNPGVKSAVSEAYSRKGEKGCIYEFSIPLSILDLKAGDSLDFNAILKGTGLNDTFSSSDSSDPSTWQKVTLSPKKS